MSFNENWHFTCGLLAFNGITKKVLLLAHVVSELLSQLLVFHLQLLDSENSLRFRISKRFKHCASGLQTVSSRTILSCHGLSGVAKCARIVLDEAQGSGMNILDELTEPSFVSERQIAAIYRLFECFVVVACRLKLPRHVDVVV